ncbi:MAG: ATP synthase F1 subunit gamma [Bacteroidaceae bacterium]|nr:ATP synthase F1 subunit gamma [Bacteroidaceae bacterium]
MASLKEIKSRIASIQSTQKITSAMRMVASAKLHHAQSMTEKFLLYKDELEKTIDSLQLTADSSMRQKDQQGESQLSTLNSQLSTLLIPISSNSGLCGAYNSNITKATLQRIEELESQGKKVRLLPIGKKIAHDLQNKGFDCNIGYFNLLERIEKDSSFAEVTFLVEFILQLHQSGEIDHVEFLHHHFKSMGSQVIQVDNLQLTADSSMGQGARGREQGASQLSTFNSQLSTFLTEPSPEELLTILRPRLLNAQTYGFLLSSLASEHAARMMAMQTADENASELLKELRLLYNKTRQQAITNELIDIMGSQVGRR